ncbi:MAG: hypothetical protein WCJ33_04215 [Pseudomonadota bacterium]
MVNALLTIERVKTYLVNIEEDLDEEPPKKKTKGKRPKKPPMSQKQMLLKLKKLYFLPMNDNRNIAINIRHLLSK